MLTPLGWALAVVLALVLLDVGVAPLSPLLIAVVGVAPWVLFLAWPLAVAALATRRWWLGGAAVVLVVLQVFVLLPSFAPWHSPRRAVADSTVTVYDQNVQFDHHDLTAIGHQIQAVRPQLVLLEELSTTNLPTLEATGAVAGYPYSYVRPAQDSRGFGLWSSLPLSGAQMWRTGGLTQVQAVVTLPDGTRVTVLQVHTVSPTDGRDAPEWDREMSDVAARVRATTGPVVVVGDFNATPAMPQLRRVLETGLTDGAVSNGEGWRMTWPNGRRVLPRIFRLDHVLTSAALTVPSYRVGQADGSDHSPLVFTLARAA